LLPSREYLAAHPFGVMFVDEFDQMDHLTQKAFAPLLLEKKIGDNGLPPGWLVVTASNRMSDRSGVVKPLMHLINRTCRIEIRHDVESLVDWMQENEIHPIGPAFVNQMPGVVFTDQMPSEPKPFCSPRSFVSALKYITQIVGSSMDVPVNDVMQNIIGGDIGEGASSSLFGWLKVNEHLPKIEDIVRDPLKAKVPPASRLDAAYVATQMCIHHATEHNTDNLWTYVERLPKDLQVSTANAFMKKRGGKLLNSKNFGKWVTQNRALIVSSLAD